jgi:hypothetical protein
MDASPLVLLEVMLHSDGTEDEFIQQPLRLAPPTTHETHATHARPSQYMCVGSYYGVFCLPTDL